MFGIKEPVNRHDTYPAGRRRSHLGYRLLKSETNFQFCSCNPPGNHTLAWAEVIEAQGNIKLLLCWLDSSPQWSHTCVLTSLRTIPEGNLDVSSYASLGGPCPCSGFEEGWSLQKPADWTHLQSLRWNLGDRAGFIINTQTAMRLRITQHFLGFLGSFESPNL